MTAHSDLFDLAWQGQAGFVAISTRDTSVGKTDPGYWRDKMFAWPDKRGEVLSYVKNQAADGKDVYWAPAVFTARSRSAEAVTAIHTLWADLDEADPDTIPKPFKPTAVWESSPGRYQAIWQLTRPLNPVEQQQLNQRLTYAIGADRGGWDLTQVLRIPGTRNHKYEDTPRVRLLYLNGHTIDPGTAIDDLPEVQTAVTDDTLPDPREVLRRYRQSFNTRIKQLLRAKHARVGERSDRLWELECLLAERGLHANEIAAVVQPTVWNKFKERNDEIRRLLVEAQKALDHAGPTIGESDELEPIPEERVEPQRWDAFDREHQPIRWLIADVWGESEVGFISGPPKSYKSWVSLDLAVSVATGTRFLGSFQAKKNDVILIQEEDPMPVLQDRLIKVAASKDLVSVGVRDRELEIVYDLPDTLHIISNQGFTLTEEWLEALERWIIERSAKLVILDPLMMIAGAGFDEFKAFDFMEKVLKPLKRLRAKTQTAICVLHHHTKSSQAGQARDMYGSVALWAWEESAMHLQLASSGKVVAERFSKHALLQPLTLDIGDVSETWIPRVSMGNTSVSIYELLSTIEGGATIEELMGITGLGRDPITRDLKAGEAQGAIAQIGTKGEGRGRPKTVWGVK